MRILTVLLFASLLTSCGQQQTTEDQNDIPTEKMIPVEADGGIGDGAPPLEGAFAQGIEKAHNREAYKQHKAVRFDIGLKFGGESRLNGTITTTTDSRIVKVEKIDGTTLLYNDGEMTVSPASKNYDGASFDLLTWAYFFSMPFKLTDPGTKWQEMQQTVVDRDTMMRAKMTFAAGTGQAPKDWYQVYAEPDSGLLHMAAYIVTVNKALEEAQKNPHAIVYKDYKVVDSVPFATVWEYYNWSEEKGLYGDAIGRAEISNISFVEPGEKAFTKAEEAASLN